MINSIIDNWKNERVFEKQLMLNKKQLTDKTNYPEHWMTFLNVIDKYQIKNILDVGCGCGAYYKLLLDNEYNGTYYGIDYSEEAINLAKKEWGVSCFQTMDYKDLTSEFIKKYDLIHLGALLDVLPNADEALEYILNMDCEKILIGRMKLTNDNSYYTTYKAYDEIETVAFHHNTSNFVELTNKYNYNIKQEKDNFLLIKR